MVLQKKLIFTRLKPRHEVIYWQQILSIQPTDSCSTDSDDCTLLSNKNTLVTLTWALNITTNLVQNTINYMLIGYNKIWGNQIKPQLLFERVGKLNRSTNDVTAI